MEINSTEQLMGLLFKDRPYTAEEQDAISRMVDAQKARKAAIREAVAADPPGYALPAYADRRFVPGRGSIPVTVHGVVPDGQSSRIGDVVPIGDRWQGEALACGGEPVRGPGRDSLDEAALDVIAEYVYARLG